MEQAVRPAPTPRGAASRRARRGRAAGRGRRPRPRLQVGAQAGDDPLLGAGAEQRPHRLGAADGRVPGAFGLPKNASTNPSAQSAGVGTRWIRVRPPSSAATSSIRPTRGRSIAIASPRYCCCQAGTPSRSNVNTTTGPRATRRSSARPCARGCQWWTVARHRRIDRGVVQRQRLRPRVDHRRRPGGAAPASSRSARPPAPSGPRLVGARPRSDVHDRLGVAQRRMDPRGDARVAAAVLGVRPAVLLVVDAGA